MYIKFKEKYLTHLKDDVLKVGYKTGDRLIAQKIVVEVAEKDYLAFNKAKAEAKHKAKAEKIAKAKAEAESKKCKECGEEECKDCNKKAKK